MLSRDDIRQALVDGHIKIHPFEERNLTGIGYNLSTTNFAFSVNWKVLLEIRNDVDASGDVRYVEIPPNDTVLFFSREYVEVDRTVAGTLHSKVSRVCQGLGHVSTTLDPTWRGQLIIAVGNETSSPVRFVLNKAGGNAMTLLFHQLDTAVTGPNVHDNNSKGRCDLLLEHFKSRGVGAKDQGKYLELERLVVGPFANSLNGNDCFLGEDVEPDAYTKRARELEKLRDRLREDSRRLRNREHLGSSQPVYSALGSVDDDELVKSCVLYRVGHSDELPREIPLYGKDGEEAALGQIDRFLRIVGFELESIEHSRRIAWQDAEIAKFSPDERNPGMLLREERRRFWHRSKAQVIVVAIAFLAVIVLLVLAVVSRAQGWGVTGELVTVAGSLGVVSLTIFANLLVLRPS